MSFGAQQEWPTLDFSGSSDPLSDIFESLDPEIFPNSDTQQSNAVLPEDWFMSPEFPNLESAQRQLSATPKTIELSTLVTPQAWPPLLITSESKSAATSILEIPFDESVQISHYTKHLAVKLLLFERQSQPLFEAFQSSSLLLMKLAVILGRAHLRMVGKKVLEDVSKSYQDDIREVNEVLSKACSPTAAMFIPDQHQRLRQTVIGCVMLVEAIHLKVRCGASS